MTFHPYGDSAVLINFEQKIEEDINTRVIALYQALQAASIPGITFYIPAYCSLTLGYDRQYTDYTTLQQKIALIAQNLPGTATYQNSRLLHIPVCYDDTFALDMKEVMQQTGLSKEEIITLHTSTPFRVYMLGFLPGFAYMGKLPEALHCRRKTTPRVSVPMLSVGLAGYQTGIYPSDSPGGWQIIGKTPIPLFDGSKKQPFLCATGDRIKFRSVSPATFKYIEAAIESDNFNIESIYERYGNTYV